MTSLLIVLLLTVAAVSAAGGYLASAVARQPKRRARRSFLLGFCCGSVAGTVLRDRRSRLKVLRAVARRRLPASRPVARLKWSARS